MRTETLEVTPFRPLRQPTATFGPLVTVTPARSAECPGKHPDIAFQAPNQDQVDDVFDEVLAFLDQEGSIEVLHQALIEARGSEEYGQLSGEAHLLEDVTGDGVPEIYLPWHVGVSSGHSFLTCNAGRYAVIFTENWQIGDRVGVEIVAIRDVNGNGLNEIIVEGFSGHGAYHARTAEVFEWNGTWLLKVLDTGGTNVKFQMDVVDGPLGQGDRFHVALGPPDECVDDPPWWLPHTTEDLTYSWNGTEYVEIDRARRAPDYRISAVYAADDAFLEADYYNALALYEMAIFDESLEPADAQLWRDLQEYCDPLGSRGQVPTAAPDENRMLNLEAYSRFRLMILHLVYDDPDSAQAAYEALIERFTPDVAGSAYADMARMAWAGWEERGKLWGACDAATEFATLHEEEILWPIGPETFGIAGRDRAPYEICQFSTVWGTPKPPDSGGGG